VLLGREALGFAAVLAGDLPLVCPHEMAVADDLLASDVQPVDPVRCGEDEAGDQIVRPAELEPVRTPDGEVGPWWSKTVEQPESASSASPVRAAAYSASASIRAHTG
jgi:hypothetical protein